MRGKIQIYRPLLTPFQCEGLIELARDRLAAAECVNLLGERRVSENRRADTFLVDADETRWLYELADGLTQEYFDVRAADELRAFSGVEVVRYAEGGYFQPHHGRPLLNAVGHQSRLRGWSCPVLVTQLFVLP